MKTIKNARKTAWKLAVIPIVMILTVLSVSAQEKNFFTDDNIQEKVLSMNILKSGSDHSSTVNDRKTLWFTPFLFTDIANKLELKNLITHESFFNSGRNTFEETDERPLELKYWMTESNYFDPEMVIYSGFNIKENDIKLENWMTADSFWN